MGPKATSDVIREPEQKPYRDRGRGANADTKQVFMTLTTEEVEVVEAIRSQWGWARAEFLRHGHYFHMIAGNLMAGLSRKKIYDAMRLLLVLDKMMEAYDSISSVRGEGKVELSVTPEAIEKAQRERVMGSLQKELLDANPALSELRKILGLDD